MAVRRGREPRPGCAVAWRREYGEHITPLECLGRDTRAVACCHRTRSAGDELAEAASTGPWTAGLRARRTRPADHSGCRRGGNVTRWLHDRLRGRESGNATAVSPTSQRECRCAPCRHRRGSRPLLFAGRRVGRLHQRRAHAEGADRRRRADAARPGARDRLSRRVVGRRRAHCRVARFAFGSREHSGFRWFDHAADDA
jgi:hypothetical protein